MKETFFRKKMQKKTGSTPLNHKKKIHRKIFEQTFAARRQQVFSIFQDLEWTFHIQLKEHQEPASKIKYPTWSSIQQGHLDIFIFFCKKELIKDLLKEHACSLVFPFQVSNKILQYNQQNERMNASLKSNILPLQHYQP